MPNIAFGSSPDVLNQTTERPSHPWSQTCGLHLARYVGLTPKHQTLKPEGAQNACSTPET